MSMNPYADFPFTLYRLYNADGQLLYVGIAARWPGRLNQHRASKHWFHTVTRVKLAHFQTRRDAARAELEAIHAEHPLFNSQGNNP